MLGAPWVKLSSIIDWISHGTDGEADLGMLFVVGKRELGVRYVKFY
jgi:hypothetical protein